jgi:hypothetical protein
VAGDIKSCYTKRGVIIPEELCYTGAMSSDRHIWRLWARNLHKWGLAGWAASLLEAAGPLNLIAAQLLYMLQPIADTAMPRNHWRALTEMLEDTMETRRFTSLLREDDIL